MNTQRVNTILLHTWYHLLHSMETWVDLLWNSSLQVLIYVFLAVVFARSDNQELTRYLIVGAIFWNVIWVSQYGICVGALWEVWSKSFSTMFITPLSLEEYLLGTMISGALKSLVAVVVTSFIAFVVYGFSVLSIGLLLVPVYAILLIFGWGMGMLILSLIFRFGIQVQALSWSIIFLIQPLGGVFYPTSILPESLRWVGEIMPTTYVFDSIRLYLHKGIISWADLIIGAILSLVYLILGYFIFSISIKQAKKSGAFARMEN